MLVFLLGLLVLLILPKEVFAGEGPNPLSPGNGSTVSSSALTWQAPTYDLYPTNPYRVQVDDDSSFSSLNKDYYTNNTYYTPILNDGTWFWKVKAKDASGLWSDWSEVWSFILTPASTPSPSSTASSTPASSPSPTSSGSPSSSFTISNIPSQINSDQSFVVSVSLSSPGNPNAIYYLKGAFKKSDGSNYFGLTKASGSWVKNGSSYSIQYLINSDSSGNWSGNLEVKPDNTDSGFTGSGDYIFKVARYTSSGSGPTWSNESTIKIVSTASDQDIITTNTSPTTKPSSYPSPTKTKSPNSSRSKSNDTLVYHIASVAGTTASAYFSSTPSAQTEVNKQKQTIPLIWIGAIFIIAGGGSIGYIYLKKNAKIPFKL